MTKSIPRVRGSARLRIWLRRGHRWLGVVLVLFVLLLSVTGIALNHASDWGLDRRYLAWTWLLDAYGIEAPPPTASFADGGYRATLLGERLYFDGREVAEDVSGLSGIATLDPLVLVGSERMVYVITTAGDLVQAIDAGIELPGPIERVGRAGDRVLLQSAGRLFRSDPEITGFETWNGELLDDLRWSAATPPEAAQLAAIQASYRGRGLTVERVLADLHSGRIFASTGTAIMDLVAVCMIVLSISGLLMWLQHNRRETELERRNGGRR